MKKPKILITVLLTTVSISVMLFIQHTVQNLHKQQTHHSNYVAHSNDKKESKDGIQPLVSRTKRNTNDETVEIINGESVYESKYGPLPALLEGTGLDGELAEDFKGKLMITESIKNRFDYFLSAVSEEGLERCINRIEENIEKTLSEEAADEAMDILYSYINYKKALKDFHTQVPSLPANGQNDVSKIRDLMDKRVELRQKYFRSDVTEAFFSDREAYDRHSLEKLEIFYDSSLTEAEKKNKMVALSAGRPDTSDEN